MYTVHRLTAAWHSAGLSPAFGRSARPIHDNCHGRIVGGVNGSSPPLESLPGAAWFARRISATWWYTVIGVLFFEVVVVFVWMTTLVAARFDSPSVLGVGIGGAIWVASTVLSLIDYRNRADAAPRARWAKLFGPLLIAVAFGAVGWALTGSWLFALFPVAQLLVLGEWPRGVRLRVTVAITFVMVCMGVIDSRVTFAPGGALGGLVEAGADWVVVAFFSVALPIMTVSSLWWWDVLNVLDRARVSESRLAATQERLRVATDVHDLQGHHLQVIALQLELAERLSERDPAAALEQLQAARRSVDDARQGTRDLALRFRSVPLRDELANAADLLHAAGLNIETSVDVDADEAPASDLGPVIRETTTNVLRHGGGKRARLSLAKAPNAWRYEISNDRAGSVEKSSEGSGLEGIRRRITEAGGTVEIRRGDNDFTVVVTVPAREDGAR